MMARYILLFLVVFAGCKKDAIVKDTRLNGQWKWVARYTPTFPIPPQTPKDDRLFFLQGGIYMHLVDGAAADKGMFRVTEEIAPNDALIQLLEMISENKGSETTAYEIIDDTLRLSNSYQGVIGGPTTVYARVK